jgi:CrcB protein
MSAAVLAGLGLLGGAGAVLRFALGSAIAARFGARLPLGTLAVNLSGCLAVGVLVGADVTGDAARLVGTGLIGAFTTFSTWAYDTHRLAQDGRRRAAAANIIVSLALGLLAVWAGRAAGAAL